MDKIQKQRSSIVLYREKGNGEHYRHSRLDNLPDTGKQDKLYSRPSGGSGKNPAKDDRKEPRPSKADR